VLIIVGRGPPSHAIMRQAIPSPYKQALMSSAYSNEPTQAQIMRALKRVPALQRDEIMASSYFGRRVYGKMRFFDALDIDQYDVKQFSFTQRGWHRFSRFDRCIYAHISIE
jgi:hypothetical protein